MTWVLTFLIMAGAPVLDRARELYWAAKVPEALTLLDNELNRVSDNTLVAQLHLMRARCLFAQKNASGARQAIGLALAADPMATFHETEDPPLWRDELRLIRAGLSGTIVVQVASRAAEDAVLIDGELLVPPATSRSVPIGLHTVALVSDGKTLDSAEGVVVKVGAPQVVRLTHPQPQVREEPQAPLATVEVTQGSPVSESSPPAVPWGIGVRFDARMPLALVPPSPVLGVDGYYRLLYAHLAGFLSGPSNSERRYGALLRLGAAFDLVSWLDFGACLEGVLMAGGPTVSPAAGASLSVGVKMPAGFRAELGAGLSVRFGVSQPVSPFAFLAVGWRFSSG